MAVFASFETIERIMYDRAAICWRITDENNDVLHYFVPPDNTPVEDSINHLRSFLDGIEGSNYCRIILHDCTYKPGKGGDTVNKLFKCNYRLKMSKPVNGAGDPSNGFGGSGMFGIREFLDLNNQIAQLKNDQVLNEMRRQNEELQKQLKHAKKSDSGDMFEKIAGIIGRELAKEINPAAALGQVAADKVAPVAAAPVALSDNTGEADPPADAKELSKRISTAAVTMVKVAGYDAVGAMEKLAHLSVNDPAQFSNLIEMTKDL